MLRGLFEGWHALALLVILLMIAGVVCGAVALVVVLGRRGRPGGQDRGATAVEYALLCVVCAIIAITLLGLTDALRHRFQDADVSTRGDAPATSVAP